MAVPAYLVWLIRKYPSVFIHCKENRSFDPESGEFNYEDATLPNPNNVEFDNFFVTLNGIVKSCIQPRNKLPPECEEDIIIAVYNYLDRLFGVVRPRKLLFLAIDGVVPRTIMNQQRARKFKLAKDSKDKKLETQRIRENLIIKGCKVPQFEEEAEEFFDLNCLAPGTHFMNRLNKCLQFYIHDCLNKKAAWKGIKVFFSDGNVPGEGKHKIMDFIRKQRFQPDFDPNSQHVIYDTDADLDLIMLGLATHEPTVTIMREDFTVSKKSTIDRCNLCHQFGHKMENCLGLTDAAKLENNPDKSEGNFIFLRLCYLRAYLKKFFEMFNLRFQYDFERILDDWVFLTLLVSNEILPPLPSLQIKEGAIDRMVDLYRKCLFHTESYLTDAGEINLERFELILGDLGSIEHHILQHRPKIAAHRKYLKWKRDENMNLAKTSSRDLRRSQSFSLGRETPLRERNLNVSISDYSEEDNEDNDNDSSEEEDEVRLWELGFKDRYYLKNFDSKPDDLCFRYKVALLYLRGLSWLLLNCYQGCPSWSWFYPYHYAPFASDFAVCRGLSIEFKKDSQPLKPMEQLLCILPPHSYSLLPKLWTHLVRNMSSPLSDFFPIDFANDIKKNKVMLPFVDETRLLAVLKPYNNKLSFAEIRRNIHGETRLYLNKCHPKSKILLDLEETLDYDKEVTILVDGILGSILISRDGIPLEGSMASHFPEAPHIINNETLTASFRDPKYAKDFKYSSIRLEKVVDPHCPLPFEDPKNKNHNIPKRANTGLPFGHSPIPVGVPRMFNPHQQFLPRPRPLQIWNVTNNYAQGNNMVFHSQSLTVMQQPQQPQQQLHYGNAYWTGPVPGTVHSQFMSHQTTDVHIQKEKGPLNHQGVNNTCFRGGQQHQQQQQQQQIHQIHQEPKDDNFHQRGEGYYQMGNYPPNQQGFGNSHFRGGQQQRGHQINQEPNDSFVRQRGEGYYQKENLHSNQQGVVNTHFRGGHQHRTQQIRQEPKDENYKKWKASNNYKHTKNLTN